MACSCVSPKSSGSGQGSQVREATRVMEGAPDRSQEPGMHHPSLVKTLLRRAFSPIYIMGRRLDEIMANLRSGFDTLCSRIHWNKQSDPGDSGGIKPGPSVVLISSSLPLSRASAAPTASGAGRQRQRHGHF